MKKLLLVFAIACSMSACKKDDVTPVMANDMPCDTWAKFENTTWHNAFDSLQTIRFMSNGESFRNGAPVGYWYKSGNCGTASLNGNLLLIESVSLDSLKIQWTGPEIRTDNYYR